MSEDVLSLRELSVEFPAPLGRASVVDRVSRSVRRGEALGMVGESGSGKTMIALSLLRLVPEPGRIAGGAIRVAGHDVLSLGRAELGALHGRDLGMVFQNPMSAFNPVRTIGWQLAASLRRHGVADRREAHARAVEALREVGLPSAAEQAAAYPHQMSGGMLQRAMIALAMINGPALLVADEPTTALDATIQAQVLDLLGQRLASAGLLLVTHNLGVAATICRRVVVVYAGRVVENRRGRRFQSRVETGSRRSGRERHVDVQRGTSGVRTNRRPRRRVRQPAERPSRARSRDARDDVRDRFRQGGWTGLTWDPKRWIRVGGGARWSAGPPHASSAYTGSLLLRSTGSAGLALRLRATQVQGNSDAWMEVVEGEWSGGPLGRVVLRAGWENWDDANNVTTTANAWQGLEVERPLGVKIYGFVYGEHRDGDGGRVNQGQAGLSYLF